MFALNPFVSAAHYRYSKLGIIKDTNTTNKSRLIEINHLKLETLNIFKF